MRKYVSSFILLVIGLLIAKNQIVIGDGSQNMVDGLMFIFLSFVYIIVLLIIVIVSLYKHFKMHKPFNFHPLLTTLIVVIIVIISFNMDMFESSTKIEAIRKYGGCLRDNIILKNNNTFIITTKEVEASHFFKGKYQFKNDTLILSRNDIEEVTHNEFTNRYIIDFSKKNMFPIYKNEKNIDSTKQLVITKYID